MFFPPDERAAGMRSRQQSVPDKVGQHPRLGPRRNRDFPRVPADYLVRDELIELAAGRGAHFEIHLRIWMTGVEVLVEEHRVELFAKLRILNPHHFPDDPDTGYGGELVAGIDQRRQRPTRFSVASVTPGGVDWNI